MTTALAPSFTQDWSRARDYWEAMFDDLGLSGKPGLQFLEVGCFEGMTTVWLLDHVLTDPSSRIMVIDTFEGSPEFAPLGVDGGFRERFERNVAPYADRVIVRQGRSEDVLRAFVLSAYTAKEMFDFAYIDGSHQAADVLTDAVCAWPLLKVGAMMVFDDFRWAPPAPYSPGDLPSVGIEAFISAYRDRLVVRHRDYQLVVEKLS